MNVERVPGTFKSKTGVPGSVKQPALSVGRDVTVTGRKIEARLLQAGAVFAECWLVGACSVLIALEPYPSGPIWHLSIAHSSRYPTWDEIKTAVYAVEPARAVVDRGLAFAQILGRVDDGGDWVDVHENCFHLYAIEDPLR